MDSASYQRLKGRERESRKRAKEDAKNAECSVGNHGNDDNEVLGTANG